MIFKKIKASLTQIKSSIFYPINEGTGKMVRLVEKELEKIRVFIVVYRKDSKIRTLI